MSTFMKIFIGVCFAVMTSGLASCSDDEKSDCDKVWDKLSDCCEWSGEVTKSDVVDECEAMEDEEGFDDLVDTLLSADCDSTEIQYYCAY